MFPWCFQACPGFVRRRGLSEPQPHFRSTLMVPPSAGLHFSFTRWLVPWVCALASSLPAAEPWRSAMAYRPGQIVTNVALSDLELGIVEVHRPQCGVLKTKPLKRGSPLSPEEKAAPQSGTSRNRSRPREQRLARFDVLASAPAQITRDRDIYRIRHPGLFQLVITVAPGLHRPEDLTRTRHLDSQDCGRVGVGRLHFKLAARDVILGLGNRHRIDRRSNLEAADTQYPPN